MTTNFKKVRNVMIALGFITSSMNAQLSGAYTIPGSYASIAAAISDLNTSGVSGAVIINIAAGFTETAPVGGYTLNSLAGASSVNNITFQKSGVGANPLISAYTGGVGTPATAVQDGVWRFVGADFITVDGIDITDPNTANPATMEFGYGFFKASVTNGCQNNTIKNCVITLNRINNVAGSGPSVDGSRGIEVVNATTAAHTTALTITSAAGANSNNKFYTNTIQNCNIGIAIIGYADSSPFANADTGNDVGGSTASTGNNIINFGGGGTAAAAAGVRTLAQYAVNVSYNQVNSNNGGGVNHALDLRGIYLNTATSAGATISNNTITLNGGGTSHQMIPIHNASGATAASNSIVISNNLINNCTYSTATSGVFYGIYNTASAAYLSIASNTLANNSTNATSGSYYNIYNSGAVTTTINISNNTIGLGTFSATSTSLELAGVYNSAGSSSSNLSVLNNVFQNANYVGSTGGTGQIEMIYNSGTRGVTNFIGNNFNNIILKSSGTTYIMYNSNATANTNTNNNFITTGFSRTVTGSNNFFGYYNFGSPTGGTATFIGNSFVNISSVGTGIVYGLYQATATSQNQVFTGNLISGITANGSVVNPLYHNYGAASSAITSNTVTNIVGASVNAILIGNSVASTGLSVSDNVVSSCTAVAATGQAVGIFHVLGAATNIFRNKVYDLTGAGATAVVAGIYVGGGGTLNIYNNLVGDLKAPITGGIPISALYLGGGTTINAHYNTIHLNATSSGLNFGSIAVYASSTPAVTLRNNIFVNNSTPTGTGKAYGYYRSSATLTNYSALSNNNLFYAGTPSASNLICFDGTNSIQTLGAYKTFMSTRDQLSVTENPPFISILGSNPNFLNLNTSIATQVEAGAIPIAGVTADYAGTVRNLSTPDIGAWEGSFLPVPACSGQPASTSVLSSQAAVCPSVSFNLVSLTSYTNPGITYQWNASTTGSASGFAPVSGATLSALSYTDLPVTTWYQLDVTCVNSGSVFSSPATAVFAGPPTLNAVSNASFICSGISTNLSISSAVSGVSYQWMSSVTGSLSGYAAITNATLATRSNTGAVGSNWFTSVISCTANPSFSTTLNPVNVVVGAVPTASAGASSNSLCASANLSLTGLTDVGVIYSWTGPGGFTSGLQNPVLTNGATGLYSLITSLNSCSSSASTVSVTTVGRLFLNTPVATPSLVCAGVPTQLTVTDYITARVNNYSFAASASLPLITLTTGSVNLIGTGIDDTPTAAAIAIGFNFNYDGNTYSQFNASPDGWISLGGGTASNQFSNVLTSTTNIPKISAYWDDLATGTTGYVRSQLLGSAPTRTLVVEWYVTIPRATTGAANSTFQALLHEGSGKIEFRYGTLGVDGTGLSSCGLTGDAVTFNSVTHNTSSNSTVTANDANSTQPASGTSYVFAPPALTYLWTSPASMSANNLAIITSTPGSSTTYSIDLGYAGCVTTRTLNVAVTNPPTVNVSASNVSVCPGNSSTLTATGATTYSWSTSSTNSLAIVTPTLTSTIYTVTGTTGPCVVSNTIMISIPGNPTITISGSSGICTGQNATLTANGAVNYLWDNGAITNSIVTAPISNITYTVTGTDALGCSTTTTQLVTVAASLSISISGPSAICIGETANLSGLGGVSYLWNTGAITSTIAPNPVVTTTYNVVGSSGTCSNSAVKVVTVNPLPTVAISGNTLICVGVTTTLAASGASTYVWNNASIATSITAAPTTTTNYSVIGTSSLGCVGSSTITVATNTVPVITIARSSTIVCLNSSATFTASGAVTYTWNPVQPQLAVITVTPPGASVYTVSGTNPAGCISSATTNIAVNSLPNVSITPASATACALANLSLLASGATTYTWNGNNSITTAAVSFSPASSTVYTVAGTNANGCVNSKTIAVTTNSLPVMAFTPSSATVCAQSAVSFTVSGADTYFWNNNNNTTTSSTFFPSGNTTYTVTGTTALGCVSTATVMATALPLPAVTVSPSFTTVCEGSTNTFTASGAVTYTWNNNTALTGSTQAIATPSASSYIIEGTGANGCNGTSQFVVVTNALPTISITASTPTVCSLQPVQLVSSGATTFTWATGVINDTTVVNPVSSTIYTVLGTNTVTGCTGTQTIAIGTVSLPAIAISPASPTVCVKTPVTLSASGGVTYSWSNGPSSTAIAVTPTANVSYTLTGTDAIGCTNIATVTIVANPLPVILVTPPSLTVCEGETAHFVASGANTYTWSANGSTSATLSIIPTFATFYSVTGIDLNNCKSTGSATINVSPCTGIASQQLADMAVTVFPNPTTGFFTARFEFEGEKTIFISNSMGQLVTQAITSNMSQDFDLSGLAKGVYFVKVSSKQASGNYKIVID
ncbi:MAG: T9SS type A sorting domain-containing protein [Bacteroidota bacterium]